jgi:hypothetical protein
VFTCSIQGPAQPGVARPVPITNLPNGNLLQLSPVNFMHCQQTAHLPLDTHNHDRIRGRCNTSCTSCTCYDNRFVTESVTWSAQDHRLPSDTNYTLPDSNVIPTPADSYTVFMSHGSHAAAQHAMHSTTSSTTSDVLRSINSSASRVDHELASFYQVSL